MSKSIARGPQGPPLRTESRWTRLQSSDGGFTLVELLVASIVMTIAGLGAYGIVIMAVNATSKSAHDSTMAMLANAVIEQVDSTLIGTGQGFLSDCTGTQFNIDTAPGGAQLTGGIGSDIDFSATPPANYQMDYKVTSPCAAGATGMTRIYDVRWHVDQIGAAAGTPSNSFLLTIAAKRKGLSLPIHVRVMVGKAE